MGKVILCVGHYAENSYYIEHAGLAIYSIEELCFYLYENAYLLDNDIANKKLITWISEECGLEELAKELLKITHKRGTLSVFVITILSKLHYCSSKELQEVENVIREGDSLNHLEKKKTGADYFAKKGKITRALSEYEKLIDEIGKNDDYLLSKVLHNVGTIYASMFEFEKAADSYLRSYEISYEPNTKIEYLMAKRLSMGEDAYVRFITDDPANYQFSMEVEKKMQQVLQGIGDYKPKAQLDEMKKCKNSQYAIEYYRQLDIVINQWKEVYRSFVEE